MIKSLCVALLMAVAAAGAAGQPAPQAKAARPSASRAASPLASQFRAQKVTVEKDGRESVEDASNVQVGDVVQYSVQHRNVSQRRLLQVDFAIPIPPGTSYLDGSASPEGAKRVKGDKGREQMQWRVEKLEPGDTAAMSLRVKIDPDPTLTPTDAGPRKPEIIRR